MGDVILVTGSGGLIGSEVTRMYLERGKRVVGIDANLRETFFGPQGSVRSMIESLTRSKNYEHHDVDVRDTSHVSLVVERTKPDAVIHCAAQPSHDLAARIPHADFNTNALGTLNVLESIRQFCPSCPIVHVSTNKVYGDTPNTLGVVELKTRYETTSQTYHDGIDESMSIDQCKHSLFGASKLAGDVLAQEYGRYFDMNVGVFRGGCLTGPCHAGVELHGFLSYIVRCAVRDSEYTIFGYQGKQVRDQIHARDVAEAFDSFLSDPDKGVVYNLGGERENSTSIIETIDLLERRLGRRLRTRYDHIARSGDHIWYISSMKKFKSRYPAWKRRISLDSMVDEIVSVEMDKL